MQTEGPYLVLYDGDCRICTASARFVAFIDIHRRIHARAIQDSGELLGGIPENLRLDAAHAVAPDGHVTTGADAMPTLVGALLGTPEAEGCLRSSPASMRMLSRLYALLVRFRGQLTCGLVSPSSAECSPR